MSEPVHFFTIVLNGEPFIRHHIEQFRQLDFPWHWHIIEGVAALRHDTAWSVRNGGRIPEHLHNGGWSIDGTTQYLDQLAEQFPGRVSIYRKPQGTAWDGKLEMVTAPLNTLREPCLLWEIDADELWTAEQLTAGRKLFLDHPDKTAAYYWSLFFVGPDVVNITRNCYANNPANEWLRTWRFRPGMRWAAHEPPLLAQPRTDGNWDNVAAINPFKHAETEAAGLVFQHYAYATRQQVEFKQDYYGYRGAVERWGALQKAPMPARLREFFPWVSDHTLVDRLGPQEPAPLFHLPSLGALGSSPPKVTPPRIAIDGIFYQIERTGIARVWSSLLPIWAKQEFGKHLVFLDRAGSAPKFKGIHTRVIPGYDHASTATDREMLQRICDQEGVDLFTSTYYTTPLHTPTMFMTYDMIPELTQADLGMPMWREKHYGIRHATAYASISQNTADDLARLFPDDAPADKITVARCAADVTLSPRSAEQIDGFKKKFGITRPYFMTVGRRENYKNAVALFKALSQNPEGNRYAVVCVGGAGQLEPDSAAAAGAKGVQVHMLRLDDADLNAAYSGAAALAYPSKYEGFGLPIIEAMASGCPVITCRRGSIPEVAGDAAYFVEPDDISAIASALEEIQKPEVRDPLIQRGLEQVKHFSWEKMADLVREALLKAVGTAREEESSDAQLAAEIQQAVVVATEPSARAEHLNRFGALRLKLARRWLDLPADQFERAYHGALGRAHRSVRASGVHYVVRRGDDQEFIEQLKDHPTASSIARYLAESLFMRAGEAGGERPGWMSADTATVAPPRPRRHTWGYDPRPETQPRINAAWNCLRCDPLELPQLFAAHARPLLADGLAVDVPASLGEIPLIDDILRGLAEGEDHPRAVHFRAAAMLYFRMHELPAFDPARVPAWLLEDYVPWTVQAPGIFYELGEKDDYHRRLEAWFSFVKEQLQIARDHPMTQRLTELMTIRPNLIPSYFTSASLKPLFSMRADIIETYCSNLPLDFTPEAHRPGERIRVGILKNHWAPGTETYATLPLFEHLPRDRFEVILYGQGPTGMPAEEQCKAKADRLVYLPNDTMQQVEMLRRDKLHFLFYAINMTAVTHALVPLAMFRLAPVQATSICSPATSGMPRMDVFLAGDLTEKRPDAQEEYREKLIKLPGSGICFDYTLRPPPSAYVISRQQLNISEQAVVLTSGANFYKVIPELRRAWARLLAAAPNTVLMLYPFGPAWTNSYPAGSFVRCFEDELRAVGVDNKRLVMLTPMDSPNDVQKVMAITDIYVDSFPYTGATSLLDPLEAGVPPITMAGDRLRFGQGDALMRELGMPELIATSEEHYIQLISELARDRELLNSRRATVREKMTKCPPFLDTQRFCANIAQTIEELVRLAPSP